MNPRHLCRIFGVAYLAAALPAGALTVRCPPDSVKVGDVCVDKYEASVWQIPLANTGLTKRVQLGLATLADLTSSGATQLSPSSSCTPAYPANFPDDGNWTPVAESTPPSPGVFAVSIPGVLPSACITWFQANQACLLSGKHLVTNREWQGAAASTPDPGTDNGTTDCNVGNTGVPSDTGTRSHCASAWGAFDMVGNVDEWVADWADQASNCTDWTTSAGIPGVDLSCFGGPGGTGGTASSLPAALIRGGNFGSLAGVFAVSAGRVPSDFESFIGFRCAR